MTMTEVTNNQRAIWADAALMTFRTRTGQLESHETVLTDLLADLRHWADVMGLTWDETTTRAQHHYQDEV
jgi:hypothetical protein